MFWFSGCKMWVLSSLTRDGTLEGEILTTGLPGKSWSLSFENVRHADVVHIEFSLFIYKITKQVVLTGLNPHSPGLYISLPMSFWEIGSWGFKSKMKKDWCSLTLMAHSFLLSWFGGSTIVPDFLKTRTTWLRMMFRVPLQWPMSVKGREHSRSLEVFKRCLCPCCKGPFKTKVSGRVEDD